tara:strand:+ start:10021 stop:10779 length:759 start_codon:yes stop_codon:yes gene_type:complete
MSGQQTFFDALLDPERPPPGELTSWNNSDVTPRFAVYRNNVVVSLIGALADTYPVTQQLVGEAFFHAMARIFVSAEPPKSRILAFYGDAFPNFIEHFPPAASVPYLSDVARLEMLRVHAFHAADATELPLDAIAQALTKTDDLSDVIIGLHPSLRLLQSKYAVVSLWAAHQGIADISTVDPWACENALVIRPQLDVEVISLHSAAANFVGCLMQGVNLGFADEQMVAAHTEFDLIGILQLLAQHQCISSINL